MNRPDKVACILAVVFLLICSVLVYTYDEGEHITYRIDTEDDVPEVEDIVETSDNENETDFLGHSPYSIEKHILHTICLYRLDRLQKRTPILPLIYNIRLNFWERMFDRAVIYK